MSNFTHLNKVYKTKGRARTKWISIKVIRPNAFGAWLSNCVDGHVKFRKLRLSRVFFSDGVQLKAEDGLDRELRGRHDIPLDEMSFQPTMEKVEWLLCSGWKRKVITLGARGWNSWVQIKRWQDFCSEERTRKALKKEYECASVSFPFQYHPFQNTGIRLQNNVLSVFIVFSNIVGDWEPEKV